MYPRQRRLLLTKYPMCSPRFLLSLVWGQMTPAGLRIRNRKWHELLPGWGSYQPVCFFPLSPPMWSDLRSDLLRKLYDKVKRADIPEWLDGEASNTNHISLVYGRNWLLLCEATVTAKLICYCSTTWPTLTDTIGNPFWWPVIMGGIKISLFWVPWKLGDVICHHQNENWMTWPL